MLFLYRFICFLVLSIFSLASMAKTTDQACMSCHQSEYEEWKTSDHFMAMQHAKDPYVLADFEDQVFEHQGSKSQFSKKNDDYYITTDFQTQDQKEYLVKFTFGHYPLQQYLQE